MLFTKATILDGTGRESFNRLANGEPQVRKDGSLWRTSRGYVVTDPMEISEKLRRADIETDVILGSRALKMDPKRSAVIVCRFTEGTEYRQQVSILLDHSGKHAIRLLPNVWRRFCANEFYGPAAIKIYHCSREAREFADDPVPFVRETFGQVQALYDFMRIGAHDQPESPDLWLEVAKHKRLAKQVWREHERYARLSNPNSAWSQLQALTQVKSPTTLRWAHEYLSGKWPVSQ